MVDSDLSLNFQYNLNFLPGIQALISKLRGNPDSLLGEDESWMNPLKVDVYCNNGTETALHHAVKKREHGIVTKLLTAGANPNLVIYAAENSPQPFEEQFYFKVRIYSRS